MRGNIFDVFHVIEKIDLLKLFLFQRKEISHYFQPKIKLIMFLNSILKSKNVNMSPLKNTQTRNYLNNILLE